MFVLLSVHPQLSFCIILKLKKKSIDFWFRWSEWREALLVALFVTTL